MNTTKTFFILILLAFSIVSCTKDDEPTASSAQFSNPSPTFSDADGVLAAIQVISYQDIPVVGEVPIYADVATAVFFESSNSYYDAGIVAVNTFDLQSLDNNSYVLPGQGSTTVDFDFSTSSANTWNIGGGANVPNFTHTTSKRMTGDVKFTGDYSSVNTSNNLTVSLMSSPVNTDSILYVLATENETVYKTVGPNELSVTFTSAEMSNLNGTGVVQAAAYNYELNVQGGKNYYFINESVVTTLTEF